MRVRALWGSFLAIWGGTLLVFGAVRPWAMGATAVAMGALYGLSLLLLPDAPRLSKPARLFLAGLAAILLLQAAPLPFLYPYTTRLRETHGLTGLWPGTADAALSARFAAQAAAYVCAGLLVLRLRQAGLTTSSAIRGLLAVAGLEAAWGVARALSGSAWIPFFDGTSPDPGSASGTLVNRNHFAGLCGMGLALAAALATARFRWPPRREEESGRPPLGRRVDAGLGWALLAALFAVALLLSKSRGGALAALAGVAALPFLQRGRAAAAAVAGGVAALALALAVADPSGLLERFATLDPYDLSGERRWEIWATTSSAALAQPLLGFGAGTHPHAFHPFQPPTLGGQVQHAHNEYVNVFFEAGFVGLAFTLAAVGVWLARAWRGLRPLHSPDRLPAAGVVAALLLLLVHSLVDFDFRITAVGLFGAALLGLGASFSRDGEASPKTAWATALLSVAAGGLAFFVPTRSLGMSPYDHALAWEAARSSGEPKAYETAAALFPAHPDLQRETGLLFWEEKDAARAAVCLKRLFLARADAVDGVMGEIFEPERPTSDYEALLPGTAEPAARMAAALARQGRWKDALELFERGVPKDEHAAPAHDLFAAELRKLGQWGLEARTRDRRLEAKSDAWAHAAAAEAWLRLGALERALERATTAERIDPRTAAWPALRAEILAAKGEGLAALEAIHDAVRKAPAELNYTLRRAELSLAEGTSKAAEDDFRAVLRSRPDDRRAALGLARALLAQERKDAARVWLDAWLSRHPDDAAAKALRERAR